MYKFMTGYSAHLGYSHFSNKREVMLTDFEKQNPPYLYFSTLQVYWFLDCMVGYFPKFNNIDFLDFSTLHSSFIAVMHQFFPNIPPSTFIDFETFAPLHIYSSLFGY